MLALGVAYGAASLAHHVHNAVYLHEYPNLPASLSVARVAAAWCLTALTGVVGYVLVRGRHELSGLLLLLLYAGLGLLGLAHYHLAPIAVHSFGMNASIGVEVATATLLLIAVVRALIARVANRPVPAA